MNEKAFGKLENCHPGRTAALSEESRVSGFNEDSTPSTVESVVGTRSAQNAEEAEIIGGIAAAFRGAGLYLESHSKLGQEGGRISRRKRISREVPHTRKVTE